jgi:hypothetical protein
MKFDVAYRGVTLFFLCLFVIFRFVLQVSSSFSSLHFFSFSFSSLAFWVYDAYDVIVSLVFVPYESRRRESGLGLLQNQNRLIDRPNINKKNSINVDNG